MRTETLTRPRHLPIFQILGKRWSALIVRDLLNRPRRFRELLASMGDINDKVLSQRLKELESLALVERKVYPDVPVRVEYSLTEKGRDLHRIIEEMERWSERWSVLSADREGKC